MSKKQIIIRSIVCGCLYCVLDILLNTIFGLVPTPLSIFEIVIESVLFSIFMRWLISTNKNSKKITNNKCFLKYFFIGMLGSWIILTIMLFFQVDNQINKVVVENIALFTCVYLVIGIICGFAMYIAFRKASKH